MTARARSKTSTPSRYSFSSPAAPARVFSTTKRRNRTILSEFRKPWLNAMRSQAARISSPKGSGTFFVSNDFTVRSLRLTPS